MEARAAAVGDPGGSGSVYLGLYKHVCLFCHSKYRERVTQHPPPSVGTLASDTGAWAGRWSTQWRRDLDPPLGTTVGPLRPPVRILCLRGESENIQATWLTCLRCVATLAQDSLSKVCSNN